MSEVLDGKRKFWLTAFIAVTGTALCFMGKVDQGGYVTLMSMILTIYGAANILDKHLGGSG